MQNVTVVITIESKHFENKLKWKWFRKQKHRK